MDTHQATGHILSAAILPVFGVLGNAYLLVALPLFSVVGGTGIVLKSERVYDNLPR